MSSNGIILEFCFRGRISWRRNGQLSWLEEIKVDVNLVQNVVLFTPKAYLGKHPPQKSDTFLRQNPQKAHS